MMRFIRFLPLIILILISCESNKESFDKNYYERITNIKFPEKYKVIATVDNGEFITITIIELEKRDCMNFAMANNFETITDLFAPEPMGLVYLDSIHRQLPEMNKLLRNWKSTEKNNWIYLLDTATNRLYCEITYPDWAGD